MWPLKKIVLEFFRVRLLEFHLDQGVLLGSNAFSGATIVVHARLTISRGEDRVPFSVHDFALFFQSNELPPHKRIVEWIGIGCDE
jgi:hypothetical protein